MLGLSASEHAWNLELGTGPSEIINFRFFFFNYLRNIWKFSILRSLFLKVYYMFLKLKLYI